MTAAKTASQSRGTLETGAGRSRPFFSPATQARFKRGRPGDRFEREADAAADGLVHGRGQFSSGGAVAARLTPTSQRTADEVEPQRTPMEAESGRVEEDREVQAQPAEHDGEVQSRADEGDREEMQPRAEDAEAAMPPAPEEEVQARTEEEVQSRAAEQEQEVHRVAEEEEVQAQAEDEDVQSRAAAPDPEGHRDEIQRREEPPGMEPGRSDEEEVQTRGGAGEEPQTRAGEELQERAAGGTPRRPTIGSGKLERRLRAARGLGNPLPLDARKRMEGHFGTGLSGIRIHTDALAVQLSEALRAQAFAHGSDIYFNEGRFAPGTPEGDHLLAHEIAHTIQQGAVKVREVQLQPQDGDTIHVRPEALEAVRLARTQIGLVNTKINDSEGNRVGWKHLLEFFRTAFGGDTIHPSVIQKITMVEKNGARQDALPHWCGIFAWWALKSAGVPLPDWKIGMNVLEFVTPRPPGSLPVKGDIAYREKNQHFALVSGVESVADAAGKPVKSVRMRSINGNTAGTDNLGGQIQEISGPVGEWLVFFDPMGKLAMPDVPLVATTRVPEETAAPLPPIETEEQAAADPSPTDVSALEEPVTATPEALPGPEVEVGLEMPALPPVPPPEPVAAVEKASLEGSSDEAMQSFATAPASSVAATGPELGAALDGKVVEEQQEAAAAVPELKAQTGGDIDLAVTSPDQIPIPAGAEVGDGVTGPTPPELVAEPHQDKAPPPTNKENERLMDRQPEGGFLAWLRGAIGNLMSRIRTKDPGVSTSAGPRGRVALQGEADPGRMSRQKEDGAAQLRAQRDEQTAVFRNHPGQSNIKPRKVDEARKPEMATEPAARITPTEASSDAQDYVGAELPQEVRDRADTDLAPVLEPGLSEARTSTAEAAGKRDSDAETEKTTAAEKARKLNEQADAEQKKVVLDNRKEVARQQGEGVAGAYDQVRQFSNNAAKEEGARRKDVADHVTDEEGKARKELEDGEKKAADKKKEKEEEAARKKEELEKDQKKQSWWDRAVNAVKKAVKAVTEAIDSIFNALRKAVAEIIEKAKQAAVGLINAARDWVVDKLNDFRDWAKAQVDKHLKEHFPGLAKRINDGIDATVDVAIDGVNAAADAAIAGVEALADGLAKALDKILSVYQTALKAAVGIAGAVLTGDFAEALKIAVQAACDIAGIDSKPIFDFFDKAGSLITDILKRPLAFINNLMSAVGQGVSQFGENIVAHLQKGLIAWLTGALTEAGIQLPEKFDLLGIFSLVAQILGLTYANVKARIIKKFPAAETVFDMVEKGFALVMKLKDLDFSGLWEEAKAQLANLKETVLGGVKQWVVTTVIKEGIVWLLSLLNPASALVKALKVIFDLVMWLVERFNQIKEFVLSVYDSVAKIAAGVLGPAAKAVEDALSRALPVVISLVASFIGLGGVGKAVKEVLEKITEPINRVIDLVIDKVVAFARKLIGKLKAGAKKVKDKIVSFIWPKKTFSVEGESHTLYFDKAGAPMIRSTPTALEFFIQAWEKNAAGNMTSQKQAHLASAKATLAEIRTLSAEIRDKEKRNEPVSAPQQQKMLRLQTDMATALKGLLGSKDAIAQGKERFKLEGLTGTYATIPKPSGDDLTGDHQPQAATLKHLRGKTYFQVKQGAKLQHRAGGKHADNAYVINLSAKRHEAGRTYGSKGKATKAAFVQKITDIEKAEPSQPERRRKSVEILKAELAADVAAMRAVYARAPTDPVWSDLDKFAPGDQDAKKGLVQSIREQVRRGQTVISAQPMAELAG